MKKTLLLLALLLFGLGSSRAEVLIYKGAASVRTVPGQALPPKLGLYMVADIAAKEVGFIVFFNSDGEKLKGAGTPQSFDITTSAVAGGGTARIFATGASGSTPPDFSHFLLYFRGIQKSITVATGTLDTKRNEPRVIIGYQLNARENTGTGSFTELRIHLEYDVKPTIKANNATRTIQQTLDDLSAQLAEKGYKDL